MFGLGVQEMIIVGIVALLLFGKRLPEVARSLGSSYHQFRRGLQDLQSEIDVVRSSYYTSPSRAAENRGPSRLEQEDYDEPTAPKFEPPVSEPSEETSQGGQAASA
jgi:sec-independent protein translocase protein TatA